MPICLTLRLWRTMINLQLTSGRLCKKLLLHFACKRHLLVLHLGVHLTFDFIEQKIIVFIKKNCAFYMTVVA